MLLASFLESRKNHQPKNIPKMWKPNRHQSAISYDFARRGLALGIFLAFLTGILPAGADVLTPGGTNSFPWLDSFSFGDTNGWRDDFGDSPISFTNITSATDGDGASLVVDSTNAAWLRYQVWEGGYTNITFNQGSVLMWFSPHWSGTNQGGAGPQVSGRLIEAGTYTTNATIGWWSLYLDPSGCMIYLSAQDGSGHQSNYIAAPVALTNEMWHQ
ncbi:MAG TPA: hypothetical protein VHB20_16875, partial [Verrucomicrobiae bacterium]|nr:hypothetical protein [Verrucomicrobiae bacterium]